MIKVLIADDEPDVLDVMARKLQQAGFAVVKAADGEIAWEMLVKEDPDVLILDINMPKKDGFTFIKELRENPPGTKWQPVIIVSGRTELADVKQGFQLDADHYITKPCDIMDIIKGINIVVSLIPQREK